MTSFGWEGGDLPKSSQLTTEALPLRCGRAWVVRGGRYWVRTSDLFGVNEARYHCANRPLWNSQRC